MCTYRRDYNQHQHEWASEQRIQASGWLFHVSHDANQLHRVHQVTKHGILQQGSEGKSNAGY